MCAGGSGIGKKDGGRGGDRTTRGNKISLKAIRYENYQHPGRIYTPGILKRGRVGH